MQEAVTSDKKYCVDCVYFARGISNTYYCTRIREPASMQVNLVTGCIDDKPKVLEYLDCSIERSSEDTDRCGIGGKYWLHNPIGRASDLV
jgi:hypothetical protein